MKRSLCLLCEVKAAERLQAKSSSTSARRRGSQNSILLMFYLTEREKALLLVLGKCGLEFLLEHLAEAAEDQAVHQ